MNKQNITSKRIWELLKDGGDIDEYLLEVPDEMFEWMRNVRNKLYSNYDRMYHLAEGLVIKVEGKDRKKQARIIKKNAPRHIQTICFALLDGKNTRPIIWEFVKPKYETMYTGDYKKEVDY